MRGFFFVVVLLYGAYYYASRHFEFDDTLVYAEKNKGSSLSAPIDYYVGLVYYQRSEYPKAQKAFQQLLTDHATSYYSQRGLYLLSSSAEYNGDWEVAKKSLADYIEQYPSGKNIESARSRLDHLKYKHGP